MTEQKPLDKKTRNKIYKEALNLFKKSDKWFYGLCWYIYEALWTINQYKDSTEEIDPYDKNDMKFYFPEIYKHRPADSEIDEIGYWWNISARLVRYDVLTQAIKETS